MKEYYRNCDPEEVDSRGNVTCERRVLHIVSTKLSYEQMRDAIIFTFDDHPIIPELVKNPNKKLDEILEEKKVNLDDREMEELRELKDLSAKGKVGDEDLIALLKWVKTYSERSLSLFLSNSMVLD